MIMLLSSYGATAIQSSTCSPQQLADNPPSNLWGRSKKTGHFPFWGQGTKRQADSTNPPILRDTYIFNPSTLFMSVICTLIKTAQHICNSKVASNMEILHLRKAFRNSGYPTAFVARALRRIVLLNKRQPVVITTVIIPYNFSRVQVNQSDEF